MPRALLLLLPLLAVTLVRSADVFVIADTANQTQTIADNAKETIAEANDLVLAGNDTVTNPDDDHEPVVRKKRTFGDVVFRGLADVLGYSVARKPPQIVFPPPLAPVPGIDAPLQAVALVPVVSAGPPPPAAPAPPPCGAPRAVGPPPCRAQAPPPPPPPKPTQPPCPRPRANPRSKPRPKPRPPPPPPPPPCARPRANPTTPSPCAPAPPPPPPPKADSNANLETITSNFRLNFNFNRAQATPAPQAAEPEQVLEQEEEQLTPVAIQPRAALLPLETPRTPRVYLDAFVVRNGVAQKVRTVDARNLNQNLADEDYLIYDEAEQSQPQQDDDYEYAEQPRGRAQAVRDFGDAVDQFWEQKKKKPKKIKLPVNDYRNVHFGDRALANQFRQQKNEKVQYSEEAPPQSNQIPLPLPDAEEEDDEITTTTQDPRRRLKPRVLPPTEHNPNQIDTITVRVPPIYKEKRPKKLHRKRPEEPDREEEEEAEEVQEFDEDGYLSDSDTDNSDAVPQTEKPKRKRRRKPKRRTRSTHEAYTAGDYDYYGNKLPISEEEKYFRGLTVPPPTKDADLARHEEGKSGDSYFLNDHERLRDDPERIRYDDRNNDKERITEKEWADESERSDDKERSQADNERSGENERSDETERTDKLSPNAQVRETGYQNNYVHSTNVQVDDPRPLVATVQKKKKKIGNA